MRATIMPYANILSKAYRAAVGVMTMGCIIRLGQRWGNQHGPYIGAVP